MPGGHGTYPHHHKEHHMHIKKSFAVAGIVVGGLFLLGLGAAINTTDPTTTSEYKSVMGERDQARQDLSTAQDDLSAALAEVEKVVGDLPIREQAVADAEAAVAKRERAVARREGAVKAAEAAVAKREKAVSKTEQKIEDSMLEPGTYLVPEEVSPGRYRTVENVSYCYMSQDKDNDIINNLGEEAGRPVFTVVSVPGSTFTIDPECGTVQKID